jgi:hypothetical protein
MNDCKHCGGSGEIDAMGLLDCAHCEAATQRATLNAAVAAMPRMPQSDLLWYCYQAGVRAEGERVKKLLDAS